MKKAILLLLIPIYSVCQNPQADVGVFYGKAEISPTDVLLMQRGWQKRKSQKRKSEAKKYVRVCDVRYQRTDDWSDDYTVTTTFISGNDLNTATNSLRYNSVNIYAVIFWDKGQESIIKLDNVFCTEVVDVCIERFVAPITGTDQEGRKWKISSY